MLGDGSYYSYPLEAGENMYYWYDGGTGYLLTIDYTDSTQQLDRYLEWLIDYAGYYDYTVDSTGTVNMGGYEYKYIKTSGQNSDGTTEHEDTYFRQIDGKLMEISIEYTGDRQAPLTRFISHRAGPLRSRNDIKTRMKFHTDNNINNHTSISRIFYLPFNPYEWEQAGQERQGYLRGKKAKASYPQPSNHPQPSVSTNGAITPSGPSSKKSVQKISPKNLHKTGNI